MINSECRGYKCDCLNEEIEIKVSGEECRHSTFLSDVKMLEYLVSILDSGDRVKK